MTGKKKVGFPCRIRGRDPADFLFNPRSHGLLKKKTLPLFEKIDERIVNQQHCPSTKGASISI